jgi:hypothetical protein
VKHAHTSPGRDLECSAAVHNFTADGIVADLEDKALPN